MVYPWFTHGKPYLCWLNHLKTPTPRCTTSTRRQDHTPWAGWLSQSHLSTAISWWFHHAKMVVVTKKKAKKQPVVWSLNKLWFHEEKIWWEITNRSMVIWPATMVATWLGIVPRISDLESKFIMGIGWIYPYCKCIRNFLDWWSIGEVIQCWWSRVNHYNLTII